MPTLHCNGLTASDQLGVERITRRLIDEFGGALAPCVIERYVSEFLDEIVPTATITRFLPVLAERSVRGRIRSGPPKP